VEHLDGSFQDADEGFRVQIRRCSGPGELLRAENADATGRQTLTLMLLLYGSDNPESADFVLPV
jgi:hypothetical protein